MNSLRLPPARCEDEHRRALTADDDALNGIDYLEVRTEPDDENQFVLEVYFIPKTTGAGQAALTAMLGDLAADPGRVHVLGGERVTGVEVVDVTEGAGALIVEVDRRGDFSMYELVLKHEALDPAYARVSFTFKAGCPSRFDCKPLDGCDEELPPGPLVDYMAKDYASFRQALIDLLPSLSPGWTERHEADLGMALVELLAYAGDQLSYYQDAAANEAYLSTARHRISVRRHASLVDYRINDGVSARTFVHFASAETPTAGYRIERGAQLLSRIMVSILDQPAPHGAVIVRPDGRGRTAALDAARVVFETARDVVVSDAMNVLPLYTWQNERCCLPRGTTTIDVIGDCELDPADPARDDQWRLGRGSFLLLEEALGPETGLRADADPEHRQVVRVVSAERHEDPLTQTVLTRVTWDPADALTFPLCISTVTDSGIGITDVSVARGNVVLADHGRTFVEWHPENPGWTSPIAGVEPRGIEVGARPYRFALARGPVSQRLPLPSRLTPVAELVDVAAGRALPEADLSIGTDPGARSRWNPAPTLLDSDPFDRSFVAEMDDDGSTVVRFGDGEYGRRPPDGAFIRARYRVGLGPAGNIGHDSLAHLLVEGPAAPPIATVRNPLPAWGGIELERAERAKRVAPAAFRAIQLRAVTEADYARVAELHPGVSRAQAAFRWTGSWLTVFLTIDPAGTALVGPVLEASVTDWVWRFTQTGYDLEVDAPIYVGLALEIEACAEPGHFQQDVERDVLEALSARPRTRFGRGFFHPDNFTFGQPLYLSHLYAAVHAVPGVASATVVRFASQLDDDPDPDRPATAANVERGSVRADRLEVIRCDNDPNFSERGYLRVFVGGGK